MTFVRSAITNRGTKLSPHRIPIEELKKYASEGKTIAEIARFKDTWEPELRKILQKKSPELLEKFKANQRGKYKVIPVKVIPEKKGPNPNYPKGLPLFLWYKQAQKDYKRAICCSECKLIIAHADRIPKLNECWDTTEEKEVPELLSLCFKCGTKTVMLDIFNNDYGYMSRLKINHINSERLIEDEDAE